MKPLYNDPLWLKKAFKDEGVAEIRGGENPRIIEMHDRCTLHAKEDEIAWCSAAVCCWMEESGVLSTKSAAAKSWESWGVALDKPRRGCVCIVRQKATGRDATTGSVSGYHVGLWLGEENNRVTLWGGNQHDMVKQSSFGLGSYNIVAYRWPEGIK